MIKTFAIEPDAIKDAEVCAHFRYFGFDKGRIIGAIPNEWVNELMRALSEIDATRELRIRIHVEELMKTGAIQRLPGISTKTTWIETAIATSHDFIQGIIVKSKNENVDKRLLDGSDLGNAGSLWDVPSHLIIIKNAKEMAQQVEVFVRHAKLIRFIDPYYCAESRYLSFVRECVDIRRQWPFKSRLCLEFHFLAKPRGNRRDLDSIGSETSAEFDKCFDGTIRSIRSRMQPRDSCTFFQWVDSKFDGADRFHERYLLTELGGVEFGGGLDSKRGKETTSVSRLSSQSIEELAETYSRSGGKLTPVRDRTHIF
jgi:hypothetical protein